MKGEQRSAQRPWLVCLPQTALSSEFKLSDDEHEPQKSSKVKQKLIKAQMSSMWAKINQVLKPEFDSVHLRGCCSQMSQSQCGADL